MLVCEVGNETIYSVAFTADGERLLAGTNRFYVYEISNDAQARVLLGGPETLYDAATAALARSHDINPGVIEVFTVRPHPYEPGHFAIGTRKSWLAVTPAGFSKQATSADVLALEYYDAQTIALGMGDRRFDSPGRFELWSIGQTHLPRTPHFKEPKGVRAVAVHRSSGLAAWTGYRKLALWHPRTQDVAQITLKQTPSALAFHPNGQLLAASQDWNTSIIDCNKRHEITLLKGHTGRVTSVAYHPGGRTLATGSADGTVRLWEVSTGKFINSLSGPTGRVYTIAYDNDGLRLAAAGDAGNVVIWDAD